MKIDSTHKCRHVIAGLAIALCVSCGGSGTPASDSPSRSPSLDYKEPARAAGDGEVLGVDNQAPADWLQAGVTNEHGAANSKVEKSAPAPSASVSQAP
jgi:hypothetical protein